MDISFEKMNEISDVQVRLFDEFLRICEILNLKYFLIHGSLLGAVVHKGCFPGDDDIDIAMSREDYEKFCKEGPKYIKKGLFIQTFESDPEFPLAMAKIRDSNTTYIQENMRTLCINHGIYIDVFPVDRYIDNPFLRIMSYLKLKISYYSVCRHMLIGSRRKLLLSLVRFLAILVYPSEEKTKKTRVKIMKSGKSSRFYSIYGSKKADLKIPCEYFDDIEKTYFAGLNVNIPKMYKEYLSLIYGNYMLHSPVNESSNGLIKTNACDISVDKPFSEKFK